MKRNNNNNNKQTRVKRNRIKRIKRIIKNVIRDIVCLIVGVIYCLDKMNKTIVRVFNKLPKVAEMAIIYSLVGMSIIGGCRLVEGKETKVIVKEKIITVEKEVMQKERVEPEQTIKEENKVSYNLISDNEKNIFSKAIELGLEEEQAILVVSISKHETGNWNSKYFNEYHNFGGVMCNTGIKKYESYEEGLTHFVRVLKSYYFDLGLNTIEQIGAKYCPVGASNDPKGLNKNWIPGVTSIYNNYVNNAN